MIELRELKKAIWEGYRLKLQVSGSLKDVNEVVRAEMRVRRRWNYKYPKEHRCFFKWTKYCPEFCNFEKPCEQLVEDRGEEEVVSYGFLVRSGNVYYFSEDLRVDEDESLLIFGASMLVGENKYYYSISREDNRFGHVEVELTIVPREVLFRI